MKKIIFTIFIIIGFSMLGCSNNNNNLSDLDKTNETEDQKNTGEMNSEESIIVMKIDDIVVDITWEKNRNIIKVDSNPSVFKYLFILLIFSGKNILI